jgi:hypothetical protein
MRADAAASIASRGGVEASASDEVSLMDLHSLVEAAIEVAEALGPVMESTGGGAAAEGVAAGAAALEAALLPFARKTANFWGTREWPKPLI